MMPFRYVQRNTASKLKGVRCFVDKSPVFKTIPIVGAFIGLSAFTFQVLVLYPWHHELSKQFDELNVVVKNLHQATLDLQLTVKQLSKEADDVKTSAKELGNTMTEFKRERRYTVAPQLKSSQEK
mmetsp:Transcript_29626/g.40706  ORF Transcript_29626/g.40706 Transcript_29626/m.40706 type:complete len:125 (-) Transcript_29626:178-552(-)